MVSSFLPMRGSCLSIGSGCADFVMVFALHARTLPLPFSAVGLSRRDTIKARLGSRELHLELEELPSTKSPEDTIHSHY